LLDLEEQSNANAPRQGAGIEKISKMGMRRSSADNGASAASVGILLLGYPVLLIRAASHEQSLLAIIRDSGESFMN
jgi:hypothetical protein